MFVYGIARQVHAFFPQVSLERLIPQRAWDSLDEETILLFLRKVWLLWEQFPEKLLLQTPYKLK